MAGQAAAAAAAAHAVRQLTAAGMSDRAQYSGMSDWAQYSSTDATLI
jgi:hypothetical protein